MIKDKDNKYIMNTYKRFPVTIVSGKNSVLTDDKGKEYIDFTSGIGVTSIGYGDSEWASEVCKQANKLSHISNLFYTEPQVELAERLIEFTKLSRVFFSNSGAEANEGAIKLARKYSCDKYGKDRTNIITLSDSFHGRTITTLKATGQDKFHDFFFPFTEGFIYADNKDADDVINKMDSTVCGVLLESIQGEGGVLPLENEFVKKIAKACKEKDILLIFDEIQTGLGRTGKFFGYEHFELDSLPDIVTMAKGLGGGLPIGCILCSEKLKDTLSYGHHGSTFGGNPICCQGGNVVMKKIANKEFLDEVLQKGNYIKEKIESFSSPMIESVRGRGLMIGIEIKGKEPGEIVSAGIEKGLLLLTAGKNVVRLLPPLTITYEEIEKGLSILESII